MRKIISIILVLSIAFLLCGCSFKPLTTVNQEYLISALGFEKANGKFLITAEALTINTEDIEEDKKRILFKGSGETVVSAIADTQKKATQPFDLSHCGLLILSENLTGDDIKKICDFSYNTEEITFSINLVSTNSPTELLGLEPLSSLAVGYDIVSMLNSNTATNGYKYKNSLYEIVASNEKAVPVFALPDIATNNADKYIDGLIIYRNYNQIAKLNLKESLAYSLITDNFSCGNIVIDNSTHKIKSSQTIYKLSKDNFDITIKIRLNSSANTQKKLKKLATELIEKSQEYYGDIFGIGNFVFYKNSVLWNEIKHNYYENYKNSKVTIT